MTISHNHAICNGCSEGTEPLDSEAFEQWETIAMQDGPNAHLCPKCQERRDRGLLAESSAVWCGRCGRNSKDHPEIAQWWGVPEGGMVCDDCHDRTTDVTQV